MEKDRRRQIRHHLECPVTIVTSEGTMSGQTSNLSGEGALILCRQPLKPRENLGLSIKFPDGSFTEVPSRVVWSCMPEPGDEKSLCGMGVRFLWLEYGFL